MNSGKPLERRSSRASLFSRRTGRRRPAYARRSASPRSAPRTDSPVAKASAVVPSGGDERHLNAIGQAMPSAWIDDVRVTLAADFDVLLGIAGRGHAQSSQHQCRPTSSLLAERRDADAPAVGAGRRVADDDVAAGRDKRRVMPCFLRHLLHCFGRVALGDAAQVELHSRLFPVAPCGRPRRAS